MGGRDKLCTRSTRVNRCSAQLCRCSQTVPTTRPFPTPPIPPGSSLPSPLGSRSRDFRRATGSSARHSCRVHCANNRRFFALPIISPHDAGFRPSQSQVSASRVDTSRTQRQVTSWICLPRRPHPLQCRATSDSGVRVIHACVFPASC